jgi:chromosome condensin MukBEF complex kleisin-like MukF subunit
LRKKIRGWHRNIEAEVKKKKVEILDKIDLLDKIAKLQQLSDQEMEERKS